MHRSPGGVNATAKGRARRRAKDKADKRSNKNRDRRTEDCGRTVPITNAEHDSKDAFHPRARSC